MKGIGRFVLPATAVGLLLSSCASPGEDVAVVEIMSEQFSPTTLVVAPGTEVRWTNQDPTAHRVTSGGPLLPGEQPVPDGAEEFDSGRLQEGETFSHVFEIEGDYYYWCEYHGEAEEVGTIRVEEP